MPLASALIRGIRFPLFATLLAAGPLAPAAAGAQLAVERSVGSGDPLHRAGVISTDLRCAATVPSGRQLAHFVHTSPGVYATPWGEARLYDLPVDALAFSPDGARLAAASAGRVIEQVQTLYPPEDRTTVVAFAFSADGRRLMELAGHTAYHVRTWTLSPPAAP
jgi:hypothetical protein